MHAQDMQIVLMPIGWETDATLSLEARAQAVINRQLVDSCDLLIGIFWTRLGTPTTEADSGTVEEIERAHNAGKRCIVYFSDQHVPSSKINQEQFQKLQEYRKELQLKGLTDSYNKLEEFKDKVFRHILTWQ
jgi:nucleoside 2-deoxyribosyltransferase